MNQTTNTKVGQAGNSLKLKARSIKRRSISRFQLLIIYMNFMKKANKKGRPARNASPARSRYSVSGERSDAGRGEENNSVVGRPKIGGMARKVAVAGFVVAAMGVWFFAVANGAEAAWSKTN